MIVKRKHRATGFPKGRPPGYAEQVREAEGDIEPGDDLCLGVAQVFHVDGRVVIPAYDENGDNALRILRDKLDPLLRELGLVPHTAPASRVFGDNGYVPRVYSETHNRITRETVYSMILAYPGKTTQELAGELYYKGNKAWTAKDRKLAYVKIYIHLRNLLEAGEIRARPNAHRKRGWYRAPKDDE
jgi:hypothetical protein